VHPFLTRIPTCGFARSKYATIARKGEFFVGREKLVLHERLVSHVCNSINECVKNSRHVPLHRKLEEGSYIRTESYILSGQLLTCSIRAAKSRSCYVNNELKAVQVKPLVKRLLCKMKSRNIDCHPLSVSVKRKLERGN